MSSNWACSRFTRYERIEKSRFWKWWFFEYFGYFRILFQRSYEFWLLFSYSDQFCIQRCIEHGMKASKKDRKRSLNPMYQNEPISKITLVSVTAQLFLGNHNNQFESRWTNWVTLCSTTNELRHIWLYCWWICRALLWNCSSVYSSRSLHPTRMQDILPDREADHDQSGANWNTFKQRVWMVCLYFVESGILTLQSNTHARC